MRSYRFAGRPDARDRGIRTALSLFMIFCIPSVAASQTPINDLWSVDGTVSAMVATGGTLYVGGIFSHIAPNTGAGCGIDVTTGQPLMPYPMIEGAIPGGEYFGGVSAVVSDGAGGWYIGGSFASVAGQARHGLARIDALGNLTSWNPDANAPVHALALSGGVLYVGGEFTHVGGEDRNRIAALDTTLGLATGWNPDADQAVRAILPLGSTTYVGGNFTTLRGQSRLHLGSIDAATGDPTGWQPNADQSVSSLAVRVVVFPSASTTLYVGGDFLNIGGQSRSYLASFNLTSGASNTPTAWAPLPDGPVYSLIVNGPTLIAGGAFSNVNSTPRNGLAAINGSGGLLAWAPALNDGARVNAMTRDGTTLYFGGYFTSIGTEARRHLGAVDLVSGAPRAWDPAPFETVHACALSGSTVFVGGIFMQVGGLKRNALLAIDLATRAPKPWNPDVRGIGIFGGWVTSLAFEGSTLYAGGWFASVGGQIRGYLAAIDANTGLPTDWAPMADGPAYALAISGGTVYAGGQFTEVNGLARSNAAAIDATTGDVPPWNPSANAPIYALAVSGSTVYAGGDFTNIGSRNRNYIAAIDAFAGDALTGWSPNANNFVRALEIDGGTMYVGGYFTNIGGLNRDRVAALEVVNGLAKPAWNAGAMDHWVQALEVDGSSLLVGGGFSTIAGQTRNRLATLQAADGTLEDWNPDANDAVWVIARVGGALYVGGEFNIMSQRHQSNIAGFEAPLVGVEELPVITSRIRLSARPNPMREATQLLLSMPVAGEATVDLCDLSGRRVRVLCRQGLPAGEHMLSWNGRDENGREASPGVYFARVRAANSNACARIVKVH